MFLRFTVTWALVSWSLCFRTEANTQVNFTNFATSRPTEVNVELISFLPSVVYDNLDGDRTVTLVTPSAGVLVGHVNYRTDPRYYTENVLESRLNSLASLGPYAKMSYASKSISATAYKAGQGAMFLKDFDAAAAPIESDGFCERELSALGPLLNTQNDICGRYRQVDTNVGFLLQVEFVEPSPVTVNWSWYLGLPFRLGNGAVVVLDGVIIQDLMGKTGYWKSVLSKTTQVDMKITPGFHVLKIYGLSMKFETSAVYFSRDGSIPTLASVSAIVGELTKWSPFVTPDALISATLTTELANKASSVGRGVSVLQFQGIPVDGRYALHLASLSTTDAQSSKTNTSSLVSFSFIPTTSWANAKATQVAFLTAVTTQWSSIPGLALYLPYSSTGVLLCSFTGRFMVEKNTVKAFRLDLGIGSSSKSPVSQFRLDETFSDPSGVPLDFSYFVSVSTESTANISLSYQYQGTKTGKIIGGRATAVFVPGAILTTDTFTDATISLAATMFSKQVNLSTASTIIIRVSGTICRNSATETFRVRISKNGDPVFDGDFYSISGTVPNGTCEPLSVHSVVDGMAGQQIIAIDAKSSTSAGFRLKGVQLQIVTIERGALISQDLCQSRCSRHGLCRLGVYNIATSTCNLYMLRNATTMATDSTRASFVRNRESTISENAWTTLRSTKWSLGQNNSLQSTSDCSKAYYKLKDRCRCICSSSHDCVGFMKTDEACYGITAADLRQQIQLRQYNASGGSTVYLNMPQTCNAIKDDAPNATNGRYTIATSTGIYDAFCNMTADSGAGYTIVPCDMGTADIDCRSSTGPKDSDSCKSMGLQQVVPRSSGHLLSMHRRYGSLYFSTVPGITNAYVGSTVELPSDEDSVLTWASIDSGRWWLRDNGSSCDIISPSNVPDERRWLGMHSSFNGQNVLDGVDLSFDPRGLVTTKYLCSTNDISPSISWIFAVQDSFVGNGDDNLWLTSWSSSDKWYQLCQGIVILGGKQFARSGSSVSKKVAPISKSNKPTNVRIKFTYYFVFDPLYWVTLLLKSSEPKTIRVYLGSQLVRQIPVDTSVTYACYGQSSTSPLQMYFHRGRERFVVRGFSGDITQLRFDTDFGSLNISAFGIDEVSMEIESSFKTSLGLSAGHPAVSCMHLKNERIANGDPNPDGQYYIQLDTNSDPVILPCSDGWIVAQRRINGKTTFNRNWNEYRDGFGLGSFNEWWIGNKAIATITGRVTEAMVVISKDGISVGASYSDFRVASETEKYLLTVRGYNASVSYATDALTFLSNTYFSTPDQDNDLSANENCAKKSRSGFWYADCLSTLRTDLNAPFVSLPICTSYAAWAQSWCQKTGRIVWGNVDGYDSSMLLLKPDQCNPGYITSVGGDCSQCPGGTYSEPRSQTCVSCPAGTYSPSFGASSPGSCLKCPAGFKCVSGSIAPVKCLAGTFADSGWSECQTVPAGYAGPFDEMSRAALIPCNNGLFSKPGQLSCSAVPAGFYCVQSGVACGYTSLTPCPSRSVYCPEGNSGPVMVPLGYYSVGSTTNEQNSGIVLCPRGFYCRRGKAYKCPPTRFGDQAGLHNPVCTGRCAIGCVCKSGSISRCPDSPSGPAEVVLPPTSIAYTLAPFTKPTIETNDSILQGVSSATAAGGTAVVLDIFEFREINATFFKVGWSSGFAHNISISYFEQSEKNRKYEFQLPVAGFDWGVVVVLDGTIILPHSKDSSLTFSFVSSWGQHHLSIIAAESQFAAKRSIFFRKTSDSSFSILRCDLFDGQPISLQIDITWCSTGAMGCSGSANINGEVARSLAQTTNFLDVLMFTPTGNLITSFSTNVSSPSNYMPTLSAAIAGSIIIVTGTNLGVIPLALRNWIGAYGVSQLTIESASLGFIFVAVNDNDISATFDAIGVGLSYYTTQLALPLPQALSNYNLISVPAGYYALPENTSNDRRFEIKKCPSGYSCSDGIRRLAYTFPATICVAKKHTLEILENDPGFVSRNSFNLITSSAGLLYQLGTTTDNVFTLDGQNHIQLLKALDYEAQNAYDLTLFVQETNTAVPYAACRIYVNVIDVNEPPMVTNHDVPRVIVENAARVSLSPALTVSDPDIYDSFTLSIISGGNGSFVIGQDRSIVAIQPLDFEVTPRFDLDILAKDVGGLETVARVVVIVQDVPEPPVCSIFTFSVPENAPNGTTIGTMKDHVFDPDLEDYISFKLIFQSIVGSLLLNETDGRVYMGKSLNFEVQDTFYFKAKFTDKTGLQCVCDYIVGVSDSNDAPVLTNGKFRVPENCVGNDCLVGNLADYAFDEDKGDVLTFTMVSNNDMFEIRSSQLWVTGGLDFESTPVLNISVSVNDRGGGHDIAVMTVQVVDVNEAPTGLTFTKEIIENLPVGTIVHTFKAFDPEGDTLVFKIIHAAAAFLNLFEVVGQTLVTKADIDYETLSDHLLHANVSICDPFQLCTEVGPNTIIIIDGPDAPVIAIETKTLSIPESVTIGTALDMSVTFSDEDTGQSAQLVYSIYSGDPQNHFQISESTGEVKVKSPLDAKIMSDYTIVLQATDTDGLSGVSSPIAIAVELVPSPPFFVGATPSGPDYNIDISQLGDGSYATVALPIADRDPGQIGGTCSITTVTDDFEISTSSDRTACELSVRHGVYIPDNERISVVLRVTDISITSTFSEITIKILSRNKNHPPVCDSFATQLLENSPYGATVGSITGHDPDAIDTISYNIVSGDDNDVFHINPTTGLVTVGTNSPDYETRSKYDLKIRVRDDAGAPLSGFCTFHVDVINEWEAPVCSKTVSVKIPENDVTNAHAGGSISMNCIDQDTGKSGTMMFVFEIVGINQKFGVHSDSGRIIATQMLDYEEQASYNITVRVQNARRPSKSTIVGVSIEVIDQNDPPRVIFRPALPSTSLFKVNVPETATPGTIIGNIVVYDEDVFDICTVSLLDASSTVLLKPVNSTTYNLLLMKTLDYETRSAYALKILVLDLSNASTILSLDIDITDINEKPYIGNDQHFFIEENAATRTIATSRFRPRGPCSIANKTTEIMLGSCISYGSCLQKCSQTDLCKAGVFNRSSSQCRLYSTVIENCMPCEYCAGFEIIAERVENSALIISADSLYAKQSQEIPGPSADFTLECWLAVKDNEGSIVAWKSKTISSIGLQLAYVGGNLRITLHSIEINTKIVFVPGLWYAVTVTFENLHGGLRLYLDGALVHHQQFPSLIGITWETSTTITIGNCENKSSCPPKPFQFSIDQLRLWKKANSFEFIRSNFARSFDPKDVNLLALFRFNGDLKDATLNEGFLETPNAVFGAGPTISESIMTMTKKWRLIVVSSAGTSSFGIAELAWFSESGKGSS
ncbi:hypothetical protein DVH05_022201 [Phytophthora capsici]|nr:hypothetical protein DVH05_022201 [Phytophthora capsici]